jgi:hypothetical protein
LHGTRVRGRDIRSLEDPTAGWSTVRRQYFSGALMADERNLDPQMDAASLYREELITDRKVGAIRKLTPVTSDGAVDPARPVLTSTA